jgi:site-specific DNA-methyltransferase (adenine-specific)
MSRYTLHVGDCRDVMLDYPDDHFDSIVSDPPYGLSFMGKGWDKGVPGEEFWREALRVAKPGANMLAFGGTRTFHRLSVAIEDAGWEIRDVVCWLYGSGFPKSHNGPWGGTALKPAWEPIIMARKRLSGTVADNVLQYGTGALNIDGCRVGTESTVRPAGVSDSDQNAYGTYAHDKGGTAGRWPANVMHDGSDEVVAGFPDSKSGIAVTRNGGGRWIGSGRAYSGAVRDIPTPDSGYTDSGSAARFFYCAKASSADRDDGNTHPTVKPTDLMRYLCRLVTPPGGVVLDPFMGSGSTGKAALIEGLRFVGIDLDPAHVAIAEARCQEAALETPLSQLTLFQPSNP